MSRSQHKVKRFSVVACSLLVLLSLLVACGGGTTTPSAEAPAAPTEVVAGEVPAEGAAGEATPTIDLAAAPVGTPVPTPLPTFSCKPDQKQIVWMVRNGRA